MQIFWKEKKIDCKMYGYLSWYYYFVTIFISIIIIINLNILDYRCLFSDRKSISS